MPSSMNPEEGQRQDALDRYGHYLSRLSDDEAVFVRRDRPKVPQKPPPPDPTNLVGAGLFFLLGLMVLVIFANDRDRPDAVGLLGLLGLIVATFVCLRSWRRAVVARARWQQTTADAERNTRFYAVRFQREPGRCVLVGPFRASEPAESATEPVVTSVPLTSVELCHQTYRGIPWADAYDPGDGHDSIRLSLSLQSPPRPQLEGYFDLLFGLPSSYIDAVGIETPGVAERIRHAQRLLGPDP